MTSRALTENEVNLVKSIFKESIDCSKVLISNSSYFFFQPKGLVMTPNGKIYMYTLYQDDFTQCRLNLEAIFIHEMVHVWQYQNKVLNPVVEAVIGAIKHKFNFAEIYRCTLKSNKDLLEYEMEQQAEIIMTYFMIKKYGPEILQSISFSCPNLPTSLEQIFLSFEKILKNFLNDPSYPQSFSVTPARKAQITEEVHSNVPLLSALMCRF